MVLACFSMFAKNQYYGLCKVFHYQHSTTMRDTFCSLLCMCCLGLQHVPSSCLYGLKVTILQHFFSVFHNRRANMSQLDMPKSWHLAHWSSAPDGSKFADSMHPFWGHRGMPAAGHGFGSRWSKRGNGLLGRQLRCSLSAFLLHRSSGGWGRTHRGGTVLMVRFWEHWNSQIQSHTRIHVNVYIYYIYIYMCVYLCVYIHCS